MVIPRLVENQRHLELLIREIAFTPKVGELADGLAFAVNDVMSHYENALRLRKALISKDNKPYLKPIVDAFFGRYHGEGLDDETRTKIDSVMTNLSGFEEYINKNQPNLFYILVARFL